MIYSPTITKIGSTMDNYTTSCDNVIIHLDDSSTYNLVYEYMYPACEVVDKHMHDSYLKTKHKYNFDSLLLLSKVAEVFHQYMEKHNCCPEDVVDTDTVAFVLEYIARFPQLDVTYTIKRWFFGHADESAHDLNRLDT